MRRYPSRGPSYSSFSFGPGPLSPAIKALIIANVAVFLLMWLMPAGLRQAMQEFLGLVPAAVFEAFRVWQPVTYMFLHDTRAIGHILFNMLASVDVRHGARADVGHEGISAVLLRDGHRGGALPRSSCRLRRFPPPRACSTR